MTTLTTALVAWEEFLRLPDARDGERYELHNGEVVVVPPLKPIHIWMQTRLRDVLQKAAGEAFQVAFQVATEVPYRPQTNMQFWYADMAVMSTRDWTARMRADRWELYPPPVVVEVLSPSNLESKVGRQRVNAMSSGAQEFWVVGIEQRTVHVTTENSLRTYREGDLIASGVLGATIPVFALFEGI